VRQAILPTTLRSAQDAGSDLSLQAVRASDGGVRGLAIDVADVDNDADLRRQELGRPPRDPQKTRTGGIATNHVYARDSGPVPAGAERQGPSKESAKSKLVSSQARRWVIFLTFS